MELKKEKHYFIPTSIIYSVMNIYCKQWWSTTPPISTKQASNS